MEQLIKDEVILPTEQEIIRYGLETLQGTLSGFILSMIIASAFGNICAGIGLYLLIFPLRKYAGGYHANTKLGCLLTSILMMATVFFVLYLLSWSNRVYVVVTAFFDIVILLLVPMENQNKRLDNIERKIYRKKTKHVLFIENFMFILAWMFDSREAVSVITMSIALSGLSLMMGLISIFRNERNCKTKMYLKNQIMNLQRLGEKK